MFCPGGRPIPRVNLDLGNDGGGPFELVMGNPSASFVPNNKRALIALQSSVVTCISSLIYYA